jgi:hypothetical protein
MSVNEKSVTTGSAQNGAEGDYVPSQFKEPPYHISNNFIFLLQVGRSEGGPLDRVLLASLSLLVASNCG